MDCDPDDGFACWSLDQVFGFAMCGPRICFIFLFYVFVNMNVNVFHSFFLNGYVSQVLCLFFVFYGHLLFRNVFYLCF